MVPGLQEDADLVGGLGNGGRTGRDDDEVLTGCTEQAVDELDAGDATAGLDHRDRRLRHAGALGQLHLRETSGMP
jgi:hypothetical protein